MFTQPRRVVLLGKRAIPWYLTGGIPKANCIAAYKPIGAASLADSYVNLVNPGTYTLFGGVDPTFDPATGWTFDGATQTKSTGITAADTQTWSMACRFSNCNANTGYMLGMTNGLGGYFSMTPRRSGTRRYLNGAVIASVAAVSASGVQIIAGPTGYINGGVDAAITLAAVPQQTIFIASASNTVLWAGDIQAVAIYNTVLSLAQVEALTAAMGFLA